MHHPEELNQSLIQLFPEGSLDATRMIQRCQKNGLFPVAASRTLVLQLGKNSPLDGQSPLIVWLGLACLLNGKEVLPDKSTPGIEEVKQDFLRHRIDFHSQADTLTWADSQLVGQMGLEIGKISPLDFLTQPLPLKKGVLVLSQLTSDLLASSDRGRPELPVIIPNGHQSVIALTLEELVYQGLGRLNPQIWEVII